MTISLEAFKDGYQHLFDTMVINPKKEPTVENLVSRITTNRARYETANDGVKKQFPQSSIPWYFTGIVHYMECNLGFAYHLHNGDPLTHRTVQVPTGRPKTGNPPFTWEESAIDALIYQGLQKETDWSVPSILFKLEGYNGYGYRSKGINSPYLFSGSNQYVSGKYIADHVYDPKAVSSQIGSALLLKKLIAE